MVATTLLLKTLYENDQFSTLPFRKKTSFSRKIFLKFFTDYQFHRLPYQILFVNSLNSHLIHPSYQFNPSIHSAIHPVISCVNTSIRKRKIISFSLFCCYLSKFFPLSSSIYLFPDFHK